MDQQRRILLFITLSMALLIGYSNFVLPLLYPPPPRVPGPSAAELAEAFAERPVDALRPENALPSKAAPPPTGLPQHPAQTVSLGSLDPESGYFLHVQLTTLGGAVDSIELNDPRYPEFGKRGTPLRLVGHDPLTAAKTFATQAPAIDAQLRGDTLESVHWEIVPDSQTEAAVAFRITSPDGALQLVKRYELTKVPPDKRPDRATRDTWHEGYQLRLTFSAHNLGGEAASEFTYNLRGPVGLPLEDPENSYKHRDVRMGFLGANGGVDESLLAAKQAVKNEQTKAVDVWKRPVQYLGVDTQYFAALVRPLQDQLQSQTIDEAHADVIVAGAKPEYSDVSVTLTTLKRTIPAGGALQDEYVLYAGPKRQALLEPIKASKVLDYGWFSPIVVVMLLLLKSLHSLGIGYGLAIVCLTCVVRGAMFPLSRHQVQNMEKIKEIQPKLKVLQEKYHKKPESLTPEETALLRDVNLKTLGGCLPLLLQMPIFFALYRSLSVSVDLRMAPFHLLGNWIDNLASPDTLLPLPFVMPFLGWNSLNLLPLLTIVLFVVQQKLTMPPPVDEEQAMQYRMMNIMMVVTGVMFYRVPAGLCVYFIASSVWGLIERWLLKRMAKHPPAAGGTAEAEPPPPTAPAARPAPPAPGAKKDAPASSLRDIWGKLQEMADKEGNITRRPDQTGKDGRKPRKK